MILGSHNSWSYLPPKKWWMVPFRFMAKCQNLSIVQQYKKGVRCFDLRVRFNKNGDFVLSHGFMEYDITLEELYEYLLWLDSKQEDIYIRILHEARNKSQYIPSSITKFKILCVEVLTKYPNLKFWCGRNLYNWKEDFSFEYKPTCEEKYSSVCSPKLIDDWWPWLFAKRNNRKILKEGTDKDILLIDYINIK